MLAVMKLKGKDLQTMSYSLEELKTELSQHNIKLSYQRLKILEYLMENRTHPSVDTIYNDLKDTITTLSRTTIYNTVNSLVDAGLLRAVVSSANEVHYDIYTANHAHFECQKCHKLIDLEYDFDALPKPAGLDGCTVTETSLLFLGVCPDCRLPLAE